MALCTVQWSSGVLGKATSTTVLLPDGGKPPFAVFYLLHGLSDDHSIWLRRTRIEEYAKRWPLIVVMPDGGRGFYTRGEDGPDYARHIGEELVAFIERNFPARRTRSARCIGGLSMGGYGALRLGLGYPRMFASVTAHSGAMRFWQSKQGPIVQRELERIFGKHPEGTDHDLLTLAKRAKKAGVLPSIRIDCGTEDFLLEDSRWLHRELGKLKVAHEYVEGPGDHNWDYWDQQVQQALVFHGRALRLEGFGKSSP
jgi:S-formylglutathione hydrolase FrmB